MPTRGKRGGGKTSGQKSNKSPQRGRGRGGRRFGGSTRDQLDKLITLREFTWTTNANQEVVINAPTRSEVERISRQFPKGAVKFQVSEDTTEKPYQVNFDASSDDEDYDSDATDDSFEDDDILDMEEAYHEEEAKVIKSIETFFADMPEHEQAVLEDYIQNLGLSDQDLVANIAAFTLYENQEIFDDIEQKTKLDLSSPVSKSRETPNYRQRNMQKSPKTPAKSPNHKSPKPKSPNYKSPNYKSPKNKTPQKSPKSPTVWVNGGFMNEDQQNPDAQLDSKTPTREEEEDEEYEEVPFNGQYSDSEDDEEDLPKKKGPDFKKKKAFTLKDMHLLNHHIRDFIQEPVMQSMPFSPMSKTQRFQLGRLASFYGLKTKSVGSGKRCYAELVKTMKTRLFSMEDATTFMEEIYEDVKIEETFENNKKKSSPNKKGKSPNKSSKSPNQKKDDKYGKYQKKTTGKPSPNVKGGALVAENAKPLDDNNLGSRLLKSMGWTGGGLGATGQGIVNPIEAVIKQDRRGLGAF